MRKRGYPLGRWLDRRVRGSGGLGGAIGGGRLVGLTVSAVYEHGRRVTLWAPDVVTVHGGYVLRLCRWVRTRDGWDSEDQRVVRDETLYASALAALEALRQ